MCHPYRGEVTVYYYGLPIFYGLFAVGPHELDQRWSAFIQRRDPLVCRVPAPKMPASIPFMAVLLTSIAVLLKPCELGCLGRFTSLLGLAIQRYRLESDKLSQTGKL